MTEYLQCQFCNDNGQQCREPIDGKSYCFWHNADTDKKNQKLSHKLEVFAKQGGILQGLQLSRADLSDINLVKHGSSEGYDLSGSNLYRCNLRGAHLFNIVLRNSSLMKADCREANLHRGKLENCNLLGIRLDGAKIEHAQLGLELQQEKAGKKAAAEHNIEQANDYFEQAEEIYRIFRKAAEQQGLFAQGGHFIHRELVMHRYCYPLYSVKRLSSKLVDLFCGYGERPLNVILFSLCLIFTCTILYFFLGIQHQDYIILYDKMLGLSKENVYSFFTCMYFSVVTFTTLGYGDIIPIGASRIVAAVEAFFGSFTLALFVVVFVKKMTR